jgi:hypothetical protein
MGAAHGIVGGNVDHSIVTDCDFSYIGGGDQYGDGKRTVRFGNGIEFWNAAHDTWVSNCRFREIYDAALTTQGDGPPTDKYNQYFHGNIVWNCEYGFEFWHRPALSTVRNIRIENNVFFNSGGGWGHRQRPDPNGRGFQCFSNQARTTGVVVRNNVFMNATESLVRIDTDWRSGLVMEQNHYAQTKGIVGRFLHKDCNTLEDWRKMTGMD